MQRLDLLHSKLCEYDYVKLEKKNIKLTGVGQHNSNSVYKVLDTQYSYVNSINNITTEEKDFYIVVFKPNAQTKKINDIINSNIGYDLLINKKIPFIFIQEKLFTHTCHDHPHCNEFGTNISHYIDGGDLEKYVFVNSGKMDFDEVKRLIAQLLIAVGWFHENNLVHGDLFKFNILVRIINGKPFLKIADLDTVAKHNKKSKELTKECSRLGGIIYGMIKLLNPVDEKIIKDIYNNDSPHSYLNSIIAGLCEKIVKSRWTVAEALSSPLFGETEEIRDEYFQQIINEADYTLQIDKYDFNPEKITLNNPFYFLPNDIKIIYNQTAKTIDAIENCKNLYNSPNPNFDTIIRGADEYDSIDTFYNFANFLKKPKQSSDFLVALNNLRKALIEEEINLHNNIISNTHHFIKLVVDVAYNEYSENIKTVINKHTASTLIPFSIFPTIHQKIADVEATKLKTELANAENYIDSFKAIRNYLGEIKPYQESSFKNILMDKLKLILHLDICFFENSIDKILPDRKRLKIS